VKESKNTHISVCFRFWIYHFCEPLFFSFRNVCALFVEELLLTRTDKILPGTNVHGVPVERIRGWKVRKAFMVLAGQNNVPAIIGMPYVSQQQRPTGIFHSKA
jgi:hypothetical protein